MPPTRAPKKARNASTPANPDATPSARPTRRAQPLILVRGFGGLGVEDEKRVAYQGFNDGTVYPRKRGENYIYEGLVLRFLKSRWAYRDATNVVGYYPETVTDVVDLPAELRDFPHEFFSGHRVVVDPGMALSLLREGAPPQETLWVFRYYDLNDRQFKVYGEALVRLIEFIRRLSRLTDGTEPKVNIIAHSMGGLIVREAVQRTFPDSGRRAADFVNKIVTLGTPHRGIAFQVLKDWIRIDAEEELERFNPEFQARADNQVGYVNFANHFPPERLLCVAGTNYRTYGPAAASWLNRVASWGGEFGPTYNRSDGLVKQASAEIPGAPRTFVHKCHGGPDSLVTSREAYEIATRFFFGNVYARLHVDRAEITHRGDLLGGDEFFFGVSVKPRGVDFDLFHQSADAENCYGPFKTKDLSDAAPAFGWAGPGRLVWEGWLDTTMRVLDRVSAAQQRTDNVAPPADLVMRLDVYVGERDAFGVGFSDDVVFRKQYYLRAVLGQPAPGADELPLSELYVLTGDEFAGGQPGTALERSPHGWTFPIGGTGFTAMLRIVLAAVPEDGESPRRHTG